jgi:hypothetical protein
MKVALVLKIYPILKIVSSIVVLLTLVNCSEDTPDSVPSVPTQSTPAIKTKKEVIKDKLDFPVVYVEELDQSQEFYKEQHETSFSFVKEKNWFSYTSEKKGILTKILLFGKPNYKPSDHYGDSMQGFIRKGNPNNGPKLGEWKLSRDDIVNQILAQGQSEREGGWITIRMRGEIPQEIGQTYFFVCDKVNGGKPWFGAFAFGDGNPYKPGRFWLHKDHDLVFRTYIGKTPEQVALEQKNLDVVKKLGIKSTDKSPKTQDSSAIGLPKSQTPQSNLLLSNNSNTNSLQKISDSSDGNNQLILDSNGTQKTQKLVETVGKKNSAKTEILNIVSPNVTSTSDDKNNSKNQNSLFNRLFNK